MGGSGARMSLLCLSLAKCPLNLSESDIMLIRPNTPNMSEIQEIRTMLGNQTEKFATVGVPFDIRFCLSERSTGGDADVEIFVSLPDGRTVRITGFWLGGNTWCARFLPLLTGAYHYQVGSCDNREVVPSRGDFIATPYTGSNDLYKHGPIEVSANKRYLRHKDGTPFFWLADTWWYGATVRCRWPDVFKFLVQDRVQKGFTVVQIVIGIPPEVKPTDSSVQNEGGFPFLDLKEWAINPSYFEYVDKRIKYLVDAGLVPCIVGGWGHHIDWMGTEATIRFWRHLVSRYSAYPVVWCLSGESEIHLSGEKTTDLQPKERIPRWMREMLLATPGIERGARRLREFALRMRSRYREQAQSRRNKWEQVGEAVSDADPVGHIITTHPLPGMYSHTSLNNAPWVGMTSIQSGHSASVIYQMTSDTMKAEHLHPRRPIINMEPWYEGILESFWHEDQRYALWMSLLAGAAGHTYGANGVWQMSTRGDEFLAHWGEADWHEAYQYPGSRHMGIAKELLSKFRWWDLEPRVDWITPHWARRQEIMPLLAIIKGELLIVYFPANAEPIGHTIHNLHAEEPRLASWFNPRTGEPMSIGEVLIDDNGDWTVPARPSSEDWVLFIYPTSRKGLLRRDK